MGRKQPSAHGGGHGSLVPTGEVSACKRMEKSGLFHVRFMDDTLVLPPSRWKLRRALKVVNEMLTRLGPDKHRTRHLSAGSRKTSTSLATSSAEPG